MKCIKHFDRKASTTCADCGAGVCKTCAEKTTVNYIVLCVDCCKLVGIIYIEEQLRNINISELIIASLDE